MSRTFRFLLVAAVALVLAVTFFSTFIVQAAPPDQAAAGGRLIAIAAANGITQTTASNAVQVGSYPQGDLQVVVDMTGANTVTLALQASNDNSHWVEQNSYAYTADGTTISPTLALVGRFNRIVATLATTAPVTYTVNTLLK